MIQLASNLAVPLLLAEGDADSVKTVIIIVVVVISLIVQAVKKVTKQRQGQNVPPPATTPEPTVMSQTTPMTPRVAQRAAAARPRPVRRLTPAQIRQQQYVANLNRVAGVPRRPQAPADEIVELTEAAPEALSRPLREASAATAGHSDASASAQALGKWMSPKTLRKQFILTEILRPPIALRDDGDGA